MDIDESIQPEIKQFCAQSQEFFVNSTRTFNDLEKLPATIAGLQITIGENISKDVRKSVQITEGLDTISSDTKALVCQTRCNATKMRLLEKRVSQTTNALVSIAADIKEVLTRLRSFSKDFSEMILANGFAQMSLNIDNCSR